MPSEQKRAKCGTFTLFDGFQPRRQVVPCGVVFQNDFVFVQKVANAVGFRPVFIGARLFPPGNQVFDFFVGEAV